MVEYILIFVSLCVDLFAYPSFECRTLSFVPIRQTWRGGNAAAAKFNSIRKCFSGYSTLFFFSRPYDQNSRGDMVKMWMCALLLLLLLPLPLLVLLSPYTKKYAGTLFIFVCSSFITTHIPGIGFENPCWSLGLLQLFNCLSFFNLPTWLTQAYCRML